MKQKIKNVIRWLENNWFKLSILFLAAITILGIFISYSNYQNQIVANENADKLQKQEDTRKKYIADQKSDCLNIYKTENAKWNNVSGWRYDELKDACLIEYKLIPKKTNAECDAEYKGVDGKVLPGFLVDWLKCYDGLFEKAF